MPYPAEVAEAMIRRPGRAPSERMEAAGGRGIQLQWAPPPPPPTLPPFLSGGGVGGGEGGGGPAVPGDAGGEVELLWLLQVARCEHHLEKFCREKLDEEVLLDMEREDFERMGVSEVSHAGRRLVFAHARVYGMIVDWLCCAAHVAGVLSCMRFGPVVGCFPRCC